MLEGTVGGWTRATSLGFSLAFLSFVPVGALSGLLAPEAVANIDPAMLPEHLDPSALPAWLDRATYEAMYTFTLVQHVVMYAVFGVILGSLQRYALRESLERAWPWILSTAAGFVSILLLEAVQRHVVIGPHAGPLEPIMIALGGGSLAGVLQWFYLRRRGGEPSRWLLFWVVGIVLGIAAAAATLAALGAVLEAPVRRLLSPEAAERIGWWVFFGVYGAVVGAVAARVSGGRLLASLRHLHAPRDVG